MNENLATVEHTTAFLCFVQCRAPIQGHVHVETKRGKLSSEQHLSWEYFAHTLVLLVFILHFVWSKKSHPLDLNMNYNLTSTHRTDWWTDFLCRLHDSSALPSPLQQLQYDHFVKCKGRRVSSKLHTHWPVASIHEPTGRFDFVHTAQKEFDVNVSRQKLAEWGFGRSRPSPSVDIWKYQLLMRVGPDSSDWFLVSVSSFIQLWRAVWHVPGRKIAHCSLSQIWLKNRKVSISPLFLFVLNLKYVFF